MSIFEYFMAVLSVMLSLGLVHLLNNTGMLGTAWLFRDCWVQRTVPIAAPALDCYGFSTHVPEIG